MLLHIIWDMSGEVKHTVFIHQVMSIFVYHIVYSTLGKSIKCIQTNVLGVIIGIKWCPHTGFTSLPKHQHKAATSINNSLCASALIASHMLCLLCRTTQPFVVTIRASAICNPYRYQYRGSDGIVVIGSK